VHDLRPVALGDRTAAAKSRVIGVISVVESPAPRGGPWRTPPRHRRSATLAGRRWDRSDRCLRCPARRARL